MPDPLARYRGYLEAAERRYSIPSGLLSRVARVESGGDPSAVSPVGAVGLMQFMPQTAMQYGLRDRTDPYQSIDAAARYLSDLRLRYRGDWRKAVAAYNAGPARVDSGRLPLETQTYVERIFGGTEGAEGTEGGGSSVLGEAAGVFGDFLSKDFGSLLERVATSASPALIAGLLALALLTLGVRAMIA